MKPKLENETTKKPSLKRLVSSSAGETLSKPNAIGQWEWRENEYDYWEAVTVEAAMNGDLGCPALMMWSDTEASYWAGQWRAVNGASANNSISATAS